ncbi:MAG TPA: hypothetical protein VGG41_07265 [Solirubrobacteraceae bacterium]
MKTRADHLADGALNGVPPRRRKSTDIELADALRALDADPVRVRADCFPGNLVNLATPGLYSWWVDADGARDLATGIGIPVIAGRIYAGQTGATQWPSGRTGEMTLKDRIDDSHLRGRVYGSTFRKTLAGALLITLDLDVAAPNKLTAPAETNLGRWMRDHLEVAVHPLLERDALGDLEDRLLAILDPPLNIRGRAATPIRRRLSRLRQQITVGRRFAPSEDPPRSD